MNIDQLIANLQAPGARFRTGIVLAPTSNTKYWAEECARLQIKPVDTAKYILNSSPTASRYINLSSASLRHLATSCSFDLERGPVVFWTNMDLLLAKLPAEERSSFFDFLFTGLPKPLNSLIVCVSEHATNLLPDASRRQWRDNDRFCIAN